jgi:hypothetical protein
MIYANGRQMYCTNSTKSSAPLSVTTLFRRDTLQSGRTERRTIQEPRSGPQNDSQNLHLKANGTPLGVIYGETLQQHQETVINRSNFGGSFAGMFLGNCPCVTLNSSKSESCVTFAQKIFYSNLRWTSDEDLVELLQYTKSSLVCEHQTGANLRKRDLA